MRFINRLSAKCSFYSKSKLFSLFFCCYAILFAHPKERADINLLIVPPKEVGKHLVRLSSIIFRILLTAYMKE